MTPSGFFPIASASLRLSAGAALLAAALFSPSSPPASAGTLRPTVAVAREGDDVPGTISDTFTFFDEPFVNTAGDVTFNAGYTGGRGVFLKSGGTLSAVALSGQMVSGVGTLSTDYDGPIFNNKSTVGFVALQIVGSSTAAVFQKQLDQSLTVVAKQGDDAPGTNGFFDTFDDIAENNKDDLAFIATYIEGGTKVGVWLKTKNGLKPIVLDGTTLPGAGGTQSGSAGEDIDGPWLNDKGTVAFITDATTGTSGSAYQKRGKKKIKSLVSKDDTAPSSVGGTIDDVAIGRPGLNKKSVGFKAEFVGGSTDSGLLTKSLSKKKLSVCVLGGDAAPDTSGTLVDMDAPAINKGGTLAFESTIAGGMDVSKGIFTCKGGDVTAIALEGDSKPGGGTFGDDISDVSLSDDGRVTFIDVASPRGVFVTP